MHQIKKGITAFALSLLASSLFAAEPVKFSNIIVFGDTLSDTGNNHWLEHSGRKGAPFTNEDKTTHQRPLWINMLVDALKPGSSVYHSSQIKSEHLDPKVNNIVYAWSNAGTAMHYLNDDQTAMPFPTVNDEACIKAGPGYIAKGNSCVPGVRQQVELYLKDVNYHPNPDTIYVFGDGDDMKDNLTKLIVTERSVPGGMFASLSLTNDNQPGYTDLSYPIINMMKAKNALIDAGVAPDHIYFVNSADVGTMPGVVEMDKTYPGIVKLMSGVSVAFNKNLTQALTATNPRYDIPASHIYSLYDFLNDVIANPAKYNFKNVTDSCVAKHAAPYCEGYAFFDDIHPSIALNKQFADRFKVTL